MKGLWRRTPLGVAWLVALGMLATGLKLCQDARNEHGAKRKVPENRSHITQKLERMVKITTIQ